MPLFGRHHYDKLVTGALDSHRSAAGLYLFRGRSQPVGVTTLFVTHTISMLPPAC